MTSYTIREFMEILNIARYDMDPNPYAHESTYIIPGTVAVLDLINYLHECGIGPQYGETLAACKERLREYYVKRGSVKRWEGMSWDEATNVNTLYDIAIELQSAGLWLDSLNKKVGAHVYNFDGFIKLDQKGTQDEDTTVIILRRR